MSNATEVVKSEVARKAIFPVSCLDSHQLVHLIRLIQKCTYRTCVCFMVKALWTGPEVKIQLNSRSIQEPSTPG